jgi:RHS repeat-associated protein
VILPTGAQIEYGYRLDSKSTAANYFHVLANPLTSKTVSINGATVEKWEFAYDINASTGVFSKSTHKAPDGGTTSHLFNPISYRTSMGPDSGIITKIVNPDGSIVNRDWQTNFPREKPSSLQWANPWVRREWTTNVNSSGSPVATSIKVFTTDKNGNTTSVEERGWVPYSATLPEPWNAALIRKTISAFLNGASDSTNTTIADDKAYSSASIISPSTPRNLRTSIETLNAGGAVQARSQFSYTETSPTRTVGNLTAEYHWDSTKPGYATLSSGASLTANNSIMKTYTYTTRGNLKQEVDARGYVSTYDYGNIYGCPSSQTSSDLYRTGAHQGQNQADFLLNWSHSYNCNSGKQISTTDPNALVTSVDYDNYGRPVTIIDGNYRKTVHTYHDASLWIVSQRDVASFNDLKNVSVLHYDQLGRVRLSRQLETSISNPAAAAADESKGIKTDTKYVFSANRNETWVSNPYRGNELGSPTQGWTVKRLDKIGRICVEEWFAGAGNPMVAENCAASSGRTGAITNKYNASLNWTVEEIADATGKTRQLFRDVLGRPLAVREDPTSARYDTYYQHDLLDNMVSVRQAGTCGSSDPVASPCAGGQTRTFAYDSLKRLSSAMNPEMDGSLVSYQYDGNGNVKSKLNSGSPSLLVSYTYDYLNRLQVRDYSDGTTPPVTYCYDGKTWNGKVGGCTGSAAVPAKGRLTEVASSNSRSFYRYNAAGQIIGSVQTTAGKSFSFDYAYNAAFALTSQTFPSGRKILVDYDDAARQKYVQGQFAGSVTNYAGSAAKEIQYAAHGAVNSMTMANGISETRGYNSRLQLTRIQAGGLLSILNCYQAGDDANCASLATVSGNSGNLQGQRIARGSQTWTQQYTYDGANRLLTANETNGWQQRYGYDAYGNRWIMSSNGLPLNVLTPTSQASFSAATNRLVGANLYDSRGNLKSYGAYTLVYDGDDRIVTAGGAVRSAKYEYDGEGRRVRMHICSGSTACPGGADAVTTVYVYDAFGKLAAEYGPVTGQTGTSYFTLDHLGSTRLETNASGQQVSCSDYLPFGEEILAGYGNRNSCFASTDNRLKFTGKERDTETGLDFFGARYYASLQGRFTSLDLAEHDLVNPQTLNRYQYVVNNPLRYIDPNGLYERDVHIDLTSALALSAGFGETSANTIAVADQAVDDNHSSASYANRKNYHFTTSERRADLWDAFQESGTAYDLGTYLHTQQDAYSHAGYSPALGHAKDGTAPDKTYNDPSKATNMAKNTFVLLGRAAGRMGIDTNKGIAWEKISASVIKFNQAKSLAVKQKAIDEIRAIVKRAQEEKKKMEEPKIKQKRIGSIQ